MENSTFDSAVAMGIGSMMLIIYVLLLIVCILLLVANWKIISKAGKPGVFAIVPIYNSWVLSEISIGKGWVGLLLLIPYLNFIPAAYLNYKIAQSFGYGQAQCIINIFIPIFTLAAGLSSAEYIGVVPDAILAKPPVNESNYENTNYAESNYTNSSDDETIDI